VGSSRVELSDDDQPAQGQPAASWKGLGGVLLVGSTAVPAIVYEPSALAACADEPKLAPAWCSSVIAPEIITTVITCGGSESLSTTAITFGA
jgi:hypothetical protein